MSDEPRASSGGGAARGGVVDVFLSYDHDDRATADRVYRALQARALTVWMDGPEIKAGQLWLPRLEEGLYASRAFALVATRRSMQSRAVRFEYAAAVHLFMSSEPPPALIGLRFDAAALPLGLQLFQWVDFTGNFDRALEGLAAGIAAAPRPSVAVAGLSRGAGTEELPTGADDPVGATPPPEPRAEITHLRGRLEREAAARRQLQAIRNASPLIGLALALLGALGGSLSIDRETLALAIGAAAFSGLFGWGVTFSKLTESAVRLQRLQFVLDGLTGCREMPSDECRTYRIAAWDELLGRAPAR